MRENVGSIKWIPIAVLATLTAVILALTVSGLQRVAPDHGFASAHIYQDGHAADGVDVAGSAPTAFADRRGINAALDFAAIADGPAPRVWDNGQPATMSHWAADPGADFLVRNGRLTNSPTITGPTAAYFSTSDLGAPITEVGARFVFEPRSGTQGSIALIVSQHIQDVIPQILGPVSVHFVAVSDKWNLTIGRDELTPLEVIAEGRFAERLKEDNRTAYQVSIEINGGRAILNLPDNTTHVVNDRRIAEWAGSYATFELYSRDGLNDSVPGFENLWAKTG
jgi:hypothetical protein